MLYSLMVVRKQISDTYFNEVNICCPNLTLVFPVSCGPGLSEKVSRRAILDRSLNYSVQDLSESHQEDDIWYNSNKLFQVRYSKARLRSRPSRCRIISTRSTASGTQ